MSTGRPEGTTEQPPIVVNVPRPSLFSGCLARLVLMLLLASVILNFTLLSTTTTPLKSETTERFISGDETAEDRIVIIDIKGTIMPPFTARMLKMIKQAKEDENVKGILLSVDSPGGLVADSHQIYHRLTELSAEKKVYVSMGRMAASGGVYVAMGAGEDAKMFAEPTTWTGSIGVIIPRYDFSKLGEKFGVSSDSLATGEFKDSMNPLKPLSDRDREVWGEILNESFDRFIDVVAEGRKNLDKETVRNELATGQIFTATQAVENGLIDGIAYEDEVIETLKKDLALSEVRVIKYRYQPTIAEILLGEVKAREPDNVWKTVMEATVPKAMYYCSWLPAIPQ